MKKSLTKWYTYLIAFGAVVIAFLASFLPYLGFNDEKTFPRVYIAYTLLLIGVIYIGGGFISQDIYRAICRKKTNNWDYPLEDIYLNKAWTIFMPLLLAGIILLIGGLITYVGLK